MHINLPRVFIAMTLFSSIITVCYINVELVTKRHCQCILTVCHILVECNHFAEKNERYIWWERCGGII